MAETILSSIAGTILSKLSHLSVQAIGSMGGLLHELRHHNDKLITIRALLLDAEEKQEKIPQLTDLLRSLKDIMYDVDDFLDDFATHQLQREGHSRQVSDFFSSSNQVAFRFKLSNRIKDINKRLDAAAEEMVKFKLSEREIIETQEEIRERETTHSFVLTSEIVGRDETKEKIIKLLEASGHQGSLSVVAIVGIGGSGKTTLAQLVYNDYRVSQYFDLKMWVCVSVHFDAKLLVKRILNSMDYEHVEGVEGLGMMDLVDKLRDNLNQKKYLLVLDDVWAGDSGEWVRLSNLLMIGDKDSKILVTTRDKGVASIMGVNSPIPLNGLEENESWSLFSKIVSREGEKEVDAELIQIGKEIVNMCSGVPLVIKTLARMLMFNLDRQKWLFIKDSIEKNTNLLSLGGENNIVFSVLKSSYDNLPTYLRPCFIYCALFPKDYEIEKKSLVQLWIAHGYIQSSNEHECLENVGNRYFNELLSRSFFEVERRPYSNKICYKMHNLIHDLAHSVIASDVLILTNVMKKIPDKIHVLLSRPVNPEIKALKGKHIRSLFMLNEVDFDDDSKDDLIVNAVIPSFNRLRALSLNKFNIKKIPKFLGNLNHLRYLDLSYNDFKVLPSSITSLKHLQTLKVIDCMNLQEFPKDLRKLVNLRHLENDGCGNLTHMPCGIGDLTSLQSLPIFVVGNGRGSSRNHKIGGLSELNRLNYLRGELRIKNLENVWNAEEESSREANLAEKQHIRSLRLEWRDPEPKVERCSAAETVMEGLRPPDQLEKLWIDGYMGERFPIWMNDRWHSALPNLVHIVLSSCVRCQILPPFAELRALKSMWLSGLDKVQYVTECSSATPFFPSLQVLQLNNLPRLKGLRKKDSSAEQDPYSSAEQDPSFRRLSKLDIGFCHELTSLTLKTCPFICELHIEYCRNLRSVALPQSPCLWELSINSCCNLTSLTLPSSPCLSKLYIDGCDKLTSLNLHSFPCLSQLTIRDCHNLTTFEPPPCPRLSQLEIRYCPNLVSLKLYSSSPLSSLEITDCPKLTSLKLPSSPCLEKLRLNAVSKEVLRQLMFVPAS